MGRAPTIRLTPGRLRWLRTLAEDGPASRPRGSVGYYCMVAGWTEWDYRVIETGEPITWEAARERWGDRWHEHTYARAERITDAGRRALCDG